MRLGERRIAVQKKNERRTSNVELRTSKERKNPSYSNFDVQRSTFDVRRSSLLLSLHVAATIPPAIENYLKRHLLTAHAFLSPPLAELSLALVGDKKMADLHLRFLSIPGPTDVLTFPLETDSKGRAVAGEVVVCVPEARRRCRENGGDLRKELLLYGLHGLLHLCGFDDRTDRQFRRMHRVEDEILTRLGVGPVFNVR